MLRWMTGCIFNVLFSSRADFALWRNGVFEPILIAFVKVSTSTIIASMFVVGGDNLVVA